MRSLFLFPLAIPLNPSTPAPYHQRHYPDYLKLYDLLHRKRIGARSCERAPRGICYAVTEAGLLDLLRLLWVYFGPQPPPFADPPFSTPVGGMLQHPGPLPNPP